MPQVTRPKPNTKHKRRSIAVGVIAFIVMALIIVLVIGLVNTRADNQAFAQTKSETATLRSNRQSEAAILKWDNYLKRSHVSKDHRYQAWLALGVLYLNEKKFDRALAYFKQCEEVKGLTYTIASAAYAAANNSGDTAASLYYLQKMRGLIPKSLPDAAAQADDYDHRIEKLKQAQQ